MLRILHSPSLDPRFNLALEEHLFTARRGMEFVMLWRNSPCVIIGRHQDARLETDGEYLERRGVPVLRRISGGGAVYHDEGNINCSFILNRDLGGSDQEDPGAPLFRALRGMGIPVEMSGRGDILCHGRKVSGSARHCRRGRILHHATLLYEADLDALRGALNPRETALAGERGHAVRSTPSSVANIRDFLTAPYALADFISVLYNALSLVTKATEYSPRQEDLAGAHALKLSRYQRAAWNIVRCNA